MSARNIYPLPVGMGSHAPSLCAVWRSAGSLREPLRPSCHPLPLPFLLCNAAPPWASPGDMAAAPVLPSPPAETGAGTVLPTGVVVSSHCTSDSPGSLRDPGGGATPQNDGVSVPEGGTGTGSFEAPQASPVCSQDGQHCPQVMVPNRAPL